ncbi:MAG: (2Fe-2S) ferredoxin domain-containing protein [Thermoanaerobaculia bacterium]
MKFPHSKHVLVCIGGRCNDEARGEERGEVIQRELKALNKAMGRKATVRVCRVSCLDLCDYGPNMVVWPEGEVYSGLDREKAREVYCAVTAGVDSDSGES